MHLFNVQRIDQHNIAIPILHIHTYTQLTIPSITHSSSPPP